MNKKEETSRDSDFKSFKLFSYNVVYSLEVRLSFIKANYELKDVDVSKIDCDTSCENPAEKMSTYLPMIRDFETIFANVSNEYNSEPYIGLFSELSHEEKTTIKAFVLSFTSIEK